MNRITGEPVPGPQRDDPDFDETYRYHTPGPLENEDFSVFSTTMLGAGSKLSPEAIDTLKHIITVVTRKTGPVVELERVVATIDEDGVWTEVELISDPPDLWKLSDECDYPRLSTFPIEIHHAIDIPKKDPFPPLDPAEDMPKGQNIGGWFLFEKENAWAYRSNQFADWSDYEHYAKDGDARLRKFLTELHERGVEATLRTLVEQVLGIWRRDDELRRKDFKSVADLARWEMTCPEFWVIAANFLGDKSPDVKNAMVQNLKRRVTYTYFVRSYADVFRLNMLRRELEDELRERTQGGLQSLVSSGGCTTSLDQEFIEYFGWLQPAECLTWTVVEFIGDCVEFGLRVTRQVGPFGELLELEPVRVLVAAALPGRVWIAEIDVDAGLDGEVCVLGHLFSLVPGHAVAEEVGKGFHFLGQERGDAVGGAINDVLDNCAGRLSRLSWGLAGTYVVAGRHVPAIAQGRYVAGRHVPATARGQLGAPLVDQDLLEPLVQ